LLSTDTVNLGQEEGGIDERRCHRRRRLKSMFKAKAKLDVEDYYGRLAMQPEERVRQNSLRTVYRFMREMQGNFSSNVTDSAPVARKKGSLCNSAQELLEHQHEHYQELLNHESATCRKLYSVAAAAAPDSDTLENAPSLKEVRTAIGNLRNGRAAGLDDISPELLKCAKEPISVALHTLLAKVWTTGKVPANWRDAIIMSLGQNQTVPAVLYLCFLYQAKCSLLLSLGDYNHCYIDNRVQDSLDSQLVAQR